MSFWGLQRSLRIPSRSLSSSYYALQTVHTAFLIPYTRGTRCLSYGNTPAVAQHPLASRKEGSEQETGDFPDTFAVVKLHNTQHKVTHDDVIFADYIPDASVGQTYTLDNVLLVGSRDWTIVGRPQVPKATVTTTCEEQTQTATKLVFRKQRRKHFQKTFGHRSKITVLRVNSIEYGEESTNPEQERPQTRKEREAPTTEAENR